jgi:uncharacterized protein
VATPDEPPVVSCQFKRHHAAMNREQTTRRALLLKRGLNAAAIALFAALAGSPFAQAASFHCPRNASASERLVCNDPALSTLDDQLAALYRTAVDASTDTAALEADRVSQWQWRQHNCKDNACVTDWYNRRIAELEGDLKHGKRATIQRVKEGVVDQQLAPSAQNAVLEIKGIETAHTSQSLAPASSEEGAKTVTKATTKLASTEASEPLRLQKMPSGVAADARQTRLADAHAHHVPAGEAAPPAQTDTSALAGKMASAGTSFAKAAGMASIDAPRVQPAKSAANSAAEKAPAQSTAQSTAQQPAQTSANQGTNAVTCAAIASAEPAHATESTIQQGTVALK